MLIRPAVLLLGVAMSAQAPQQPVNLSDYEPITVGDARIDARAMRPFEGQWRVVETGPNGVAVEIERSSERVDRIRKDGRSFWRQVQHEIAGNSGISDMLVLTDGRTFAPLIAEQRDVRDGSLKRISYDGPAVTVECGGHLCPPKIEAPANGTGSKSFRLDNPVFDYWGGIFATLPLKVGAKYRLPAFHPVQGLIWLRVEVTGEEEVNAGGGRMKKAFRIVTPQTGWVYHVSKSPPYWLRLEYRMQGKPGVVQVTERV
jgi:hypothetical protein